MTIGHRKQLMGAVKALNGDIKRWEAQIAEARLLVERLSQHADVEGGITGSAAAVPPKKRRRRRHKSRPVIVRKAGRPPVVALGDVGRNAPKSGAKRPTKTEKPVQVAAPVKAVRGATVYAAELKALDEIVAALAVADKALNKATRAKDGVGITSSSEEIHQLRRRGDEQLVALNGRAKLPAALDKKERMRWKRAAAQPVAKAPRKKAPRKPAIPIPPPVIKRTDWRADENGTMSREIITS
jgi:hypothetical protein